MGDGERIRRPVLDRTKPIRNWAAAVSPGLPIQNQIGPEMQNANRVVEEYLRAGQASARLFQGALGTASGGGDSQDVAQRMVRAASDLMTFWFEFMARSAGGVAQTTEPAAASNPQPTTPNRDPSSREPLRVTVEVDSARPTKVTIDLRQEARGSKLYLDRLHPRGSSTPPLAGAEIDTSSGDDVVVFRLSIAADQATGVYNGVILDEATSLPTGTISIEVLPARPASPAKTRE